MKLKHFLLIIFLLILFITSSAISYSYQVFSGLQENIFRLHILANSDSDEDQALKLLVRDNILDYMKEINKNSKTKEETISNIENHLSEIEEICKRTLNQNNSNYTVSLEIGRFYFPTKYYGNISLPAGDYDALRINIGEANGKNWWCSLFPPLCFIDISSGYVEENDKEILENNLSEEEFSIIASNSPDIKLKFKILELLNKEK